MLDLVVEYINKPGVNVLITIGGFVYLRSVVNELKTRLDLHLVSCKDRLKWCMTNQLTRKEEE